MGWFPINIKQNKIKKTFYKMAKKNKRNTSETPCTI